MTTQFELIRDAKVEVKQCITYEYDGGRASSPQAEIIVNDMYVHRFSPASRVSQALHLMKPESLAERLTGGSFFFVEDTLVDFRDSTYNGFIHTDRTISNMFDIIGYERTFGVEERPTLKLQRMWRNYQFDIPEFKQAKNYEFVLHFKWSPFVKTVNSMLHLFRGICTNQLWVATNGLINTKIPLINRWQEHLDIAAQQINNKMIDLTKGRLRSMVSERASVGECILVEGHALARLGSYEHNCDADVRKRIQTIIARVSPSVNLENVYTDRVFNDRNLAAQLPAHLTALDLFNIATELRTHSNQTDKSTARGLDTIAQDLLYKSHNDIAQNAHRIGKTVNLSSFSDPTCAFFGNVN